MTKQIIQKNIKLSHEFDNYLIRNKRIQSHIPERAHIIITSSDDKNLSEANISIARNSRSGRFVVAHKNGSNWHIKPFSK